MGTANALLPGRITRFPFHLPEKAVDFLRHGSGSCATTSTPIRKWISPTPSLC